MRAEDYEQRVAAARGRARREEAEAARARENRERAGRIGANERRMRAMMVPPPKAWKTREGVTMMLISATSVSPPELAAGVEALRAARGGLQGDQAALLAALAAMGFEYRREGV